MLYNLTVKRYEGEELKTINSLVCSDPVRVLRGLAECYRESNKATRKNEHIKKAKAWEAFAPDGLKAQKFRLDLVYDEANKYIYEYEFIGCGLD